MSAQFANEQSEAGEFQRQEDTFREWIGRSTFHPAVAGRYHLYVSLACPWASRTVIFRKLKGLEDGIGMTVVDPIRDEKGWAFRLEPDPVNGFQYLSEAYAATDPNFDERVTVPVLWDKEAKKIVNNCEDDICVMFNDAFSDVAANKDVDLMPKEIEAEHAKISDFIYDNVNNGVYKAGFATRQRPYEISCRKLFEALDEMEKRLTKDDARARPPAICARALLPP
ncbi:MAG: glutathione S-transferase family protein, partial [Spartobacteria bacterium]